ncbi:GEgh16 protein [Xylariales sp. AK1849]|nr:GEgh16 protein [Xylariales sp. AK1849]
MPSLTQSFVAAALLAVAHGQGLLISAQGDAKSPASLSLQVDTTQADANVINVNEITTNVVNECGRTLLGGNIDIGENTEDQLGNKTVTSVTKGSNVDVTIRQVNSDGAGPYTCDLDLTSNGDGATGQTPLAVTEKDNQNGNITLSVTMPADMACIGASTGNVCTVRCFNSAAAGPFGGCFAVQQTDVTPNQNTPDNIVTEQTLAGISAQVAQNQKDLSVAKQANIDAPTQDEQGVQAVDELLNIDSAASVVSDSVAPATTSAAAAATSAASGKAGKKGKGAKNARAFTS